MDNDVNRLLVELFLNLTDDPAVQGKLKSVVSSESKPKLINHVNSLTQRDRVERLSVRNEAEPRTKDRDILKALAALAEEVRAGRTELEKKLSTSCDSIINAIDEKFSREQSRDQSLLEECNILKGKNETLFKENNALKEENTDLRTRYDDLKKLYEPLESFRSVWSGLNSLDEETKSYIGSLCGSFSMLSCISLGRDFGKLSQLWQYLRDAAVGSTGEDQRISILVDYFEFCVQMANSCSNEPEKYSFFDVEIGSECDRDKCIKTANSKQIGTVRRVVVKGVTSNNKIVFQAIAEVG